MRLHDLPRLVLVVASAVTFGSAVPLGCDSGGGCEEVPLAPAYRVLTNQPDWVFSSGRVERTADRILISYETTDGSTWEVEYSPAPP